MSFGKSRAKLLEDGDTQVTFADVAGLEEAKEEVEAVDFLKEPQNSPDLVVGFPKVC